MSKGKSVTSEVIKLKNVRLSFSDALFAALKYENNPVAKFSSAFLLDPANKEHAKTIKQIQKAAKSLYKKVLEPEDIEWDEVVTKNAFGLAEDHPKKRKYDGYEEMYYVSASNTSRPTVVDADKSPLVESDGKPYAGCYVNTNITLWCVHNTKYDPQININLRIVQFVKDGDAFGSGGTSADELDDIDFDDDDENFLD